MHPVRGTGVSQYHALPGPPRCDGAFFLHNRGGQKPVIRSCYPTGIPSNQGILTTTAIFAVWEDPFKKPCYLFALVAGDLAVLEDQFTTASGRDVALKIYSEQENIGLCGHAMTSLKQSMAWDEERFGREYDLDLYQIVAINDFNAGAMENKGLNIFNAKYVLADPQTATDDDFMGHPGRYCPRILPQLDRQPDHPEKTGSSSASRKGSRFSGTRNFHRT